jgi:MFS family permease
MKSLDFTHGVWMIYLYTKGLSLIEIGLLESVFHITSFVMETPTGAIADLYGRKTSRILGRISSIIAILLMLSSDSMLGFTIAFIFTGLSYNLESGADSAFVYDNLRHLGEEDQNMKVNGINEVLYQVASSIGLLIAGFIAVKNMEGTYLLNLAMAFIGLTVLLTMKETTIQNENKVDMNPWHAIKNQYKITINIVKNDKKVFFYVMFLNITGAMLTTAFFFQQNFWKSVGFTEAHIGIFLAIHSFFAAVGGYSAHRVEKRFKAGFILRVLPIFFVLLLFFL